MQKLKNLFWFCLAFICNPVFAIQQTDTLAIDVYYRQGGYKTMEKGIDDQRSLDHFVAEVNSLTQDPYTAIEDLTIVSYASPEGNSLENKELSRMRTSSLGAYLKEQLPVGVREKISEEAAGVDWAGLADLIERSDMPRKDEALRIVRETPEWITRDGKVVDGRKKQLADLAGGSAWAYMEEHLFPSLRRSSVAVHYVTEDKRAEQAVSENPMAYTEPEAEVVVHEYDPVVTDLEDTPKVEAPVAGEPESVPFYWALKTNMLYDAALVPNIGMEVYLGKGFSVNANWMYAWWRNDPKHDYWRIYGGEIGVRKYLGRRAAEKPLSGHHVGLFFDGFTYDFEFGERGNLSNFSWATGLEYGYSLPIARRLNLDFGLGIGYLGGKYKVYDPMDGCYVWKMTKQRRWFGPIKAEISLVWLLGKSNYNEKKGGAR